MNFKQLMPTVVLAALLVGTAASSAAAATPDSQPASSANWAGYVAGGATGGMTRQFTSVSGSWVEPSADCTSSRGYGSFWVGLGGAGVGAGGQAQALEQVGTEADCAGPGADGADHFAWYELVPAAPVRLDLVISPGDHMSGRVTVSGTSVSISLADQTTGAAATKTLHMAQPDLSSAEWVAEAPSSCDGSGGCQPLPLADFASVSFTNASATAGDHTGTISDPNWSHQPVTLDEITSGDAGGGFVADGSSAGAAPSQLSTEGSSFSVSWLSSASQSASSAASASAGGFPSDGTANGSSPGSGYGYDPGYGSAAGSGYGYDPGYGIYPYSSGDGVYGIGGLYG